MDALGGKQLLGAAVGFEKKMQAKPYE